MKNIFLNFLLLVTLLVVVFRQNYAVGSYCIRDSDSKPVCIPPYACNMTRNICMYHLNDISSSKKQCILEHKGCAGGGPPPHQLKL
ncbi:PREDICTED: putative defensin-like protein 256 [Camelina sativa]|uniref:Defensin-like protein 256 n=1 Tax=Camelina sativa TaxID=90675 RepID=A0ABM1RJG9_CAMSA|nr:PREDICTED: putative defensin-like protein 256 [Camelina sativa]